VGVGPEALEIGDRVAFLHESPFTGPQITEGVVVAVLDEGHVLVQHAGGSVHEYPATGLTTIPGSRG
jgi:hypothetical protein